MLKMIAAGGFGIAAIATGLALLAFSPVSCACVNPLQSLAMAAGLDYMSPNIANYSAHQLETGLNANLIGQTIGPSPPNSILTGCVGRSATNFTCFVPTNESVLLSRGFAVSFVVQQSGVFEQAHVEQSWAWL